eukprot:1984290-Prymnesium_polylepis.2
MGGGQDMWGRAMIVARAATTRRPDAQVRVSACTLLAAISSPPKAASTRRARSSPGGAPTASAWRASARWTTSTLNATPSSSTATAWGSQRTEFQ